MLIFAHHMRRPSIHVTELFYQFGATVLTETFLCSVRSARKRIRSCVGHLYSSGNSFIWSVS